MRIIRLGKTLHEEISAHAGFLCTVQRINQHGFYGMGSNGRPIYFMDEQVLHVPFGVVLDQPLAQWVRNGQPHEGDRFFKNDGLIYRWPQNDSFIKYSPEDIVDLDRTLYKIPPAPEIIRVWVQRLLTAVADEGRFEGMGGSLAVIMNRFSYITPEDAFFLSPASRYGLPGVSAVLKAAADGDAEGFLRTWESLIGLGPGLTPSADDMLVGFLASQKMLSTPFWGKIQSSDFRQSLRNAARGKTTSISAEIVRNALDGLFSEILYLVFEALAEKDPYRKDGSVIKDFLKWGHSSGTDTLAGVILGLSTLC